MARLGLPVRLLNHCGRYHLTLAAFQAAIKKNIDGLSTTAIKQLKTMMKINSQQFEDVSLMAA